MRTIYLAAFAVLGTVGLLSLDRCTGSPELAAAIMRSAGGVDGFEMRHSGFGAERLYPGNFSLDYAIWANYPYVVYRGEEYRRAGPGSVVVRKAAGPGPRYLVEETAIESERVRANALTELVVSDRTSGDIMARRYLRMGQSENGHGWAGQHAGEFLRKVLSTDAPIGGRVGGKPYGRANATLDVLLEQVEAPAERAGVDCPASYRVDKQRPRIALDTGAWVFVAQDHLNSFACHGDTILVESGHGDQLRLDLLSTSGEHLFEAELAGKLDRYARNALTGLRLQDGKMSLEFVHAPYRDRGATPPPARLLRATIALPPGTARAPSG